MRIFDFLKSSEKRKQDEIMHKLQKQIFPGGISQIEKETKDIRELLNFKYTKEEVKQTYTHAAAIYFIAEDKSSERIVGSILYNESSVVTKADAILIFKYLQKKYITDPLETLENEIDSILSEIDNLFLVAKGGIDELKRSYKDLSNKGKFEVIIFNSFFALLVHKKKDKSIKEGIFKSILNQAKTYQINDESENLMTFINSRFKLYSEEFGEIMHLLITAKESNILGKLYSIFYLSPLTRNPKSSIDLDEKILFIKGLTIMVKWVHDNTKKI